jgi:hypothetical protein
MSIQSYQSMILDRLARVAEYRDGETSVVMITDVYGMLIVTDGDDWSTMATLSFDFQKDRVSVLLNRSGFEPMDAPRDDRHFRWTPGKSEDDAEFTRLMTRWITLLARARDNRAAANQ